MTLPLVAGTLLANALFLIWLAVRIRVVAYERGFDDGYHKGYDDGWKEAGGE